MNNEIGIAGWLFSQQILRQQSMSLLDLPAVCAAQGMKTVELCSKFFVSQETGYLNEVRQKLEDCGQSVRSIAVDMGNIAGADPVVRRTDIEGLKQWFHAAAAIGSQAIRINTGSAEDGDVLKRVIDGYSELSEVGAQTGIKLLVENHGGVSARSAGLQQILDGVPSEWFGTCPDTGNFETDDWEQGMQILAPRAFSCHVKVFTCSADGWQKWEDRGGSERGYDLKKSLAILREAGYEGPLCIEKGPSAEPQAAMVETAAYLRELLAD